VRTSLDGSESGDPGPEIPGTSMRCSSLNGVLHYLWRAVDQHGVVLDIFVQDRRNAAAAKRFFRRLLHGLKYKPRRLVTDGLRSYGIARREILPDVRHRTSTYLV
jgi:putative transposase